MGVNVCCRMKVKTYQVMSFLQTLYFHILEFQKTVVQNSRHQLGVCCRQVPVWWPAGGPGRRGVRRQSLRTAVRLLSPVRQRCLLFVVWGDQNWHHRQVSDISKRQDSKLLMKTSSYKYILRKFSILKIVFEWLAWCCCLMIIVFQNSISMTKYIFYKSVSELVVIKIKCRLSYCSCISYLCPVTEPFINKWVHK